MEKPGMNLSFWQVTARRSETRGYSGLRETSRTSEWVTDKGSVTVLCTFSDKSISFHFI